MTAEQYAKAARRWKLLARTYRTILKAYRPAIRPGSQKTIQKAENA